MTSWHALMLVACARLTMSRTCAFRATARSTLHTRLRCRCVFSSWALPRLGGGRPSGTIRGRIGSGGDCYDCSRKPHQASLIVPFRFVTPVTSSYPPSSVLRNVTAASNCRMPRRAPTAAPICVKPSRYSDRSAFSRSVAFRLEVWPAPSASVYLRLYGSAKGRYGG